MEGQILETFEQLWTRLSPELLRYYRRSLPNPADAEDLVQEAFLQFSECRGVLVPEALLRTIAERLLGKEYRAEYAQPHDLSWDALIGTDGAGLDHIPQFQTYDYEDSSFAESHDVAVRGLDDSARAAYILTTLRGLASREAGPLLGVSHSTAATRRDLATAAVRKGITT
jgi:RNA polymerase sigma factor (sigma-70 family)